MKQNLKTCLNTIKNIIFLTLLLAACTTATSEESYTLFESGQTRPLALSGDGNYLYALNTPDNRLEIFRIFQNKLKPITDTLVGLEPVALAVASNGDVWVVNHLSDSISIVDLTNPRKPFIKETLKVGDEPRDIVFAGTKQEKAFITTAARGQNHPNPAPLTVGGVGRADVWVYNTLRHPSAPAQFNSIVRLFTDTPRALAVSPDRNFVYAAGFHTGNQTTTIFEELIPNGGIENGGLPPVTTDADGIQQPETGLIVRFNGEHWVDELGRSWDDQIRFNLPDKDVFIIDANRSSPKIIDAGGEIASVGTILFNMAVNPVSGTVYVSNTEALNENRFEGHGDRLGIDNTVRGQFVQNRVSIIKNGQVTPLHLNKHIDYSHCCDPIPNAENDASLALPLGMTVAPDGKYLFVAAFGSAKIGVYSTETLENNSFDPFEVPHIQVTGGGPSSVIYDEKRNQLYTLTRFDNGISTVDLTSLEESYHITMYSPEPAHIIEGRKFLYDAQFTSSRGDSACASCHVFGDLDSLAWDLGNPDATTITNPGPFATGPDILLPDGTILSLSPDFAALKGPMTTQSLRGMANHGPMHWRGDRTGGNDAPSLHPNGGSFNERAAFSQFNPAFDELLGRDDEIPEEDMSRFTDFILELTYPPNPIRHLDNSLTPEQAAGRDIFFGEISDGVFNCAGCHLLDRDANKEFGVNKPGFFGTDGRYARVAEPQVLKVPHLRNMYQKVGMFGFPFLPSAVPGDNGFTGDQIRGFGFFHDGSVDTIFRFHGANSFVARPAGAVSEFDFGNQGGFPFLPSEHPDSEFFNEVGIAMRRQVEAFNLVFDTNLFPIVGQQVTINKFSDNSDLKFLQLMVERAQLNECDLVARLRVGRKKFALLLDEQGYKVSFAKELTIPEDTIHFYIQKFISGFGKKSATFTCAPPGSGKRIALDRDLDGIYDDQKIKQFKVRKDLILKTMFES